MEDNIYTVEYSVDEKFLNDKNKKFSVILNQSVYLYKSKQPNTSAYENTGDVASHYLSPYILLVDKTLKGGGWTYVRLRCICLLISWLQHNDLLTVQWQCTKRFAIFQSFFAVALVFALKCEFLSYQFSLPISAFAHSFLSKHKSYFLQCLIYFTSR